MSSFADELEDQTADLVWSIFLKKMTGTLDPVDRHEDHTLYMGVGFEKHHLLELRSIRGA